MKNFFRKSLKILLWILGSIITLLLLLLLLIQIPAVQNFIKDEAVSFLEGKFNTPVHVGKLDIDFPKKIVLEDFYLEDQEGDTLAAGQRLAVNINFYKLISNTFDIGAIELQGAFVHIKRDRDSVFNFDYMAEAFASDTPVDTTAAMEISLGTIDLDNVRFKMNDALTKIDMDASLNHLDTRIGTFDPDNMIYEIPKLNIDGMNLRMDQGMISDSGTSATATVSERDSEETQPISLSLGDIALTNIQVVYNSEEANINSAFSLDELQAEFNELQLNEEFISLSNLEVTGLKGEVIITQSANSESTSTDTIAISASNNWKVKVNDADFNNLAFRFIDENAPAQERGINWMDLDIDELSLNAENFYYSIDSISGRINSFTAEDKSGLIIKSLETEFAYANSGAYLENLYLETPQTILRDKVILKYESLETLQNNIGEAFIDANIENSKVGFKDILLLAPDLRDINPFQSNPNAVVSIDGNITGQIDNLTINNFEASGIGNTNIAISGKVTGLPDAENAYYNLNIRNFKTTAADINEFVPPGTIPDSIQLPANFSATGNFTGTAQNFDTKMTIESSSGNAKIDATIDMRQENAERYQGNVVLNDFDLGRLIGNDSIGELTLNIKADGIGFDPATANATASGTIQKAEYNSYTYNDLQFEGSIVNGNFNANAEMDDSNIDFSIAATGNFQGEYPTLQLEGDIRNLALDSLNLYGSPLRIEGNIQADLETADPDYLNGKIFITDLIAQNATEIYPLDTISIISYASPSLDSLKFNSQFLDAQIKGQYQLTQIGGAVINSISRYYDLSPTTSAPEANADTIQPQVFTFQVDIDSDPVIAKLVPQLDFREPVKFTGGFNSETDSIGLQGKIVKLRYLDYDLTNLDVDVSTEGNAINYSLVIDDVESPQLQLFHTEITGEIKNNIIDYLLQIDDSTGDPHYRIAGEMEAVESSKRFSLEVDNVLLNYDKWKIPENNSITFGPQGIHATNFELSHQGNALRINSRTNDPSSPLEVEFESFKLETISAMISKDTLLAAGTLNGEIIIDELISSPQFNADLKIENFSFKRDTVGDIGIRVNNETVNSLQANVTITGQENDAELAGTYNTETGGLDFNFDINRLGIESIQGFSMGNITDGAGFLSGDLRIEGTIEKPAIIGDLVFNDVGFRVVPLNSYFQNMNDRISFNREGIGVDNFTLSDENNNELVVDGRIATTDYTDYGFNLTVNAENFRAINSTKDDNEFYYGTLVLDTQLTIGGSLEGPVVNGSINIKEGTALSIVLPQEDPTIADREGVVEFVDETSRRMAEMREIEEAVSTSELEGMDVSVNIDINEEAEFTIVIDEGNGDFLNLQGEAQLTAGIDPSGKTSLSGRYEFTKGAYEMSFNFIKRRFEIEPGSYIQWNGEPTNASINITAIYETETAPIDLLGNQLANLTQSARNTYKQELPFQTILKMTGDLLEPELSFDIRLPERNYSVSTEIINSSRAKLEQLRQQPSELNKQVFALLLLNRFIGENPFASAAGGTSAESLARQSVSKILSQQLNDLASDLIGGVELNFDLNSTDDYTTGQREQRTDLNVGLSKTLLNDRLKVTIGSSFGLEGPQQSNQQANNIAGDIAIDYDLSKDGRYKLRAYRKNQYEVALQGQIIETGVAFIITMDYDYFMEIFGKAPDDE